MSKVLGVDLGSGFSCMSILEGKEPTIIPNSEGQRTTPSIVAWTSTGEILVGQSAKRQAITNAKNTVYEIKRFIGRKYSECEEAAKLMSYEICAAENGDCRVKIGDKLYSPEEISAMILKKLKKDAEAYLGETITDCVITVPAYFADAQKTATKNAGIIAGFNVLRIINEPTSAALSYGIDKEGDKIVAVFDDGSCTTDVSILSIGDGVIETLAVNGINTVGGRNYDEKIMEWLIEEFKKENGIDLSKDKMAIQRIKDEAEKAKIALSTATTVEINLPFISADSTGPKHLVRTLTRAHFEKLVDGLNESYTAPVKQCLEDAGKKVDEVILVGGTCRIPSIQKKIEDLFGMKPKMAVSLDESVSRGASLQGGIIKGDVTDVLLLDVTPLTLSICTNGQVATPMIPKNTTIPTKKTETFSNAAPMQPQATIMIAQGERKMFNDNKLLGQFNVELTPMPNPGQNQIEITYDVDANGILKVEAFDKALNKKANITITSSSGLSKEEIEKAKADAEAHAAEDEKRLAVVNEKNRAESLCNAIERAFKDAPADKITEDEKKPVNEAIAKVREVLKTDDIDKIKAEVEAMNKLYEPLATKLYAGTNSSGATPNFSAEDLEKMKSDPKFAEMFKNMGTTTGNNSTTEAPKTETKFDAEV